jgi:hypothetical protein
MKAIQDEYNSSKTQREKLVGIMSVLQNSIFKINFPYPSSGDFVGLEDLETTVNIDFSGTAVLKVTHITNTHT